MAWARDEADADALEVVVGIPERVDFELAPVARARIDLTDRERAVEALQYVAFEAACRGEQRLIRFRRRFGPDAGDRDLFE